MVQSCKTALEFLEVLNINLPYTLSQQFHPREMKDTASHKDLHVTLNSVDSQQHYS